jgi:hypothetical protein
VADRPDASTYDPYLLLHNVMRVLAADGCHPVLRYDADHAASNAARDLLRALGIEPAEETVTAPEGA